MAPLLSYQGFRFGLEGQERALASMSSSRLPSHQLGLLDMAAVIPLSQTVSGVDNAGVSFLLAVWPLASDLPAQSLFLPSSGSGLYSRCS